MSEFTEIWQMAKQTTFYQVARLVFLSLIAISWAGMVSYVSKDSEKRYHTEKARLFYTLLTLFTYIAGFLIYLLVRPGRTLEERKYEQYLEEGSFASCGSIQCKQCLHQVQEKFTWCPHCGTKLYDKCLSCGNPVREQWQYCPYCREKLG